MANNIYPLKAEKFLDTALKHYEAIKGSYIYNAIVRDLWQKTDQVNAGYGQWLRQMLEVAKRKYNLKGGRILDFGCGTGELTVRMGCLGYEVYGLDVHEEHLALAKILAVENGLSEDIFILNTSNRLPFPDAYLDIITMFSVLEHLDDTTLDWLLPELKRVCRGIVYVLVPNRLKPTDDHTGLRFVPWMPRWLACSYVKLRGKKHAYFVSRDGSWDVFL